MTQIRSACKTDLPELIKIGRQIHGQTRFHRFDYDPKRVEDNLKRLIGPGQARGTHCMFIAEDEQGISGVLAGVVERHLFSDQPVANVMLYYCFPDRRGNGAGLRLLLAYRRWAMNREVFEIGVSVTSGIELQRTARFLQRLGFESVGGNFVVPGSMAGAWM